MSHLSPDSLRARHLLAYYAGRKVAGRSELDALTGQASTFARASTGSANDAQGNAYTVPAHMPIYSRDGVLTLLRVDEDNEHAWELPFLVSAVAQLAILVEYVESGRAAVDGQILFRLHDATLDMFRVEADGGSWKLVHDNGTSEVSSAVEAAPEVGQRVQLLAVVRTTVGDVQLRQRLMGDDGIWGEWESGDVPAALAVGSLDADTARLSFWDATLAGTTDLAFFDVFDDPSGEFPPSAYDLARTYMVGEGPSVLLVAEEEAARRGLVAPSGTATFDIAYDISGNGRNPGQATALQRFTLMYGGGRWFFRSDGVNDNATLASPPYSTLLGSGDHCIVVVGRVNAFVDNVNSYRKGAFVSFNIPYAALYADFDAGPGISYRLTDALLNEYVASVPLAVDTWFSAVARRVAGVAKLRVNSDIDTSSSAFAYQAGTTDTLILGRGYDGDSLDGDWSVIGLYPGTKSDAKATALRAAAETLARI